MNGKYMYEYFSSSKGAVRRNLSAEVFHFENIVEITAETVIALYEIGIETDADSGKLLFNI